MKGLFSKALLSALVLSSGSQILAQPSIRGFMPYALAANAIPLWIGGTLYWDYKTSKQESLEHVEKMKNAIKVIADNLNDAKTLRQAKTWFTQGKQFIKHFAEKSGSHTVNEQIDTIAENFSGYYNLALTAKDALTLETPNEAKKRFKTFKTELLTELVTLNGMLHQTEFNKNNAVVKTCLIFSGILTTAAATLYSWLSR